MSQTMTAVAGSAADGSSSVRQNSASGMPLAPVVTSSDSDSASSASRPATSSSRRSSARR
ncbi:Uncharacterised protein [Chromobacterium violaceum]|uniref:Uncharacterized protein n=1 Tax=Chromobacterium violaceum TaxID=536 RepID=A0A3S4JVF9_CHRVL|nr:Uncharacterised protein [Chromobacterium violaceum]